MSEELLDEVTSINSIYGDNTLSILEGQLHSLVIPAQPHISLRLDFPSDYPDAPPSVLGTQSVGIDTAKGEGNQVVGVVREVLAEVYTPGVPCIFDLIEESGQRLQQLCLDRSSKDQEQQATQTNEELGDPPSWTVSEVLTEKKSVFVARAAPVSSVDEAKAYLAHLLATDKKVAKATHNITAWRVRGEGGVQYQDCDDDGETAAGGRLLHLLELMNSWNVMVVVTRWYGGIHLGPDRFRLINQCGRDAVVKAGFGPQEEGGAGKKKGKK
ncbi:hypothetical protein AC579_798 [Pseudocercospora musae]|uniref:RWD domain-containing protein n=1 Tax=Pseudocercospora musae TaxID=113226 RepID=A0A139IHB1_9PEZI|nr:hypothetical protein AC579_798 [Pseudocercospora musae]